MQGFKVIPVGPLSVNSTILFSNSEAFIFDPGADAKILKQMLEKKRLKLNGIFLTHGHIDHFGAVKFLKEYFPETKVYLNPKDKFLLSDELWPGFAQYLKAELNPPIDCFLKEGDKLNLGNLSIEVYETPGHTPGSVVFYISELELLIVGDLLFKGGIGRWDLPGGNLEELKKSLKKVFSLFPDATKVIPGHYELTTLGYERKNNPYVRELNAGF